MKNNYKFSVIMPIYNTARYLDESIGSIINQTIGFEDNIQLILVNDGSTDSSASICNAYKNMFPNNIIYISQDNMGASQARNAGIPYICGDYVNFFDSDDIWSTDAFEKVYKFFEQHKSLVDVISCPQCFFEAKSGFHNLNNKFNKGSRIINIHETPEYIQLSTTSSFIVSEAVKRHSFDSQLAIGEDAKFITEIILEKEQYGVLHNANYNIRKRTAHDSVTQNPPVTKYTKTIDNYYKYLPELSIKKYGCIIPYVQHIIINGLKYRALSSTPVPLLKDEHENYIDSIISLIKLIDDEVILTTNNLMAPGRLYLLKLKYGESANEHISINNSLIHFKNHFVGYMNVDKIFFDSIKATDNICYINGHLNFPLNGELHLYAVINNVTTEVPLNNDSDYDRLSFNGDKVITGKTFSLSFALNPEENRISFNTDYNGCYTLQNIMSSFNKTQLSKGVYETEHRKIIFDKKCINIK